MAAPGPAAAQQRRRINRAARAAGTRLPAAEHSSTGGQGHQKNERRAAVLVCGVARVGGAGDCADRVFLLPELEVMYQGVSRAAGPGAG
jgi:hypothetical protein